MVDSPASHVWTPVNNEWPSIVLSKAPIQQEVRASRQQALRSLLLHPYSGVVQHVEKQRKSLALWVQSHLDSDQKLSTSALSWTWKLHENAPGVDHVATKPQVFHVFGQCSWQCRKLDIPCPGHEMPATELIFRQLSWWTCRNMILENSTANSREHLHKIWSYMVQYLHFRILKFPNGRCSTCRLLNLWDLPGAGRKPCLLSWGPATFCALPRSMLAVVL